MVCWTTHVVHIAAAKICSCLPLGSRRCMGLVANHCLFVSLFIAAIQIQCPTDSDTSLTNDLGKLRVRVTADSGMIAPSTAACHRNATHLVDFCQITFVVLGVIFVEPLTGPERVKSKPLIAGEAVRCP